MIREVLIIGDERLVQVSQEVKPDEFNTHALAELITDMRDTMHEKGGVGIAAVQICYHKRVLLIEYDGNNPRYAEIGDCPLTVIINPQIENAGAETMEYNEGCLSVPDERGLVNRPKRIRYKYYNQLGELCQGEDDGFFARVLQHEVDHLDGILFPTRVLQMCVSQTHVSSTSKSNID